MISVTAKTDYQAIDEFEIDRMQSTLNPEHNVEAPERKKRDG